MNVADLPGMTSPGRQDLPARALRFSVRLLRFTRRLGQRQRLPARVVEQLSCAGTAIGANLSEAQSAASRKQMAQCYAVALREALESEYWLRLARELDEGEPDEALWLLHEAGEFVAMLSVSVRKLRLPAD